jgi:omega-3 fatty acid desaturase (delta-15 desaturase)
MPPPQDSNPKPSSTLIPEVPDLITIKKAIPEHCFHSSVVKSFQYVFLDIFLIILLYVGISYLDGVFFWLAYPFFAFLQGTLFWSLFVLGHDCGHGSFSRHYWLNCITGTLLHTFICVPYHPWKLSHHHHHKNTGNIDKDEVFYPIRKGFYPPSIAQHSYFGLGLGWLLYLFAGYSPRYVHHFNAWDPIFKGHELEALYSIVALFFMTCGLAVYGYYMGVVSLILYYGIPWFVFASWLVVTTFLHHNEPDVPWFSDSNWNYTLGNLSSIDRDYGLFHWLTHNIGTHQIHHLFPIIPHYHLMEATRHFRKAFPHLIRENTGFIPTTFIENFQIFAAQQIIDPDLQVFSYQKKGTVSTR